MVGKTLQNLRHDDSRYLFELPPLGNGTVFSVAAEVTLSPSNSVVIALGDEINPECLTLRCVRGQWTALVGDQLLGFSDPLPPPVIGTHSYKIHLSIDTSKGRFTPAVTVSVDGGNPVPANHLAPPPSAWRDVAHPDTWTQATVSLTGAGSGVKSLLVKMAPPPTLIIIR
ncbi:MAG: hypothetical protein FWF84_07675 [Kiritimatiellaeota bacterium]|nr:hypothetical protein [Kiritimatiellota bacterium]